MIVAILVTSQSTAHVFILQGGPSLSPSVVTGYSATKGFAHFFAGLCVGLSGLASGYCMGDIGDAGLKVSHCPVSTSSLIAFLSPGRVR